MKRVYIAYRYNSDHAGTVLSNIGVATKIGFYFAKKGYAPYIPHSDFLLAIMFGKNLPLDFYYEFSMEWLRVCDFIAVVDDGQMLSKGVLAEIEEAKRLGIPRIDVNIDGEGNITSVWIPK